MSHCVNQCMHVADVRWAIATDRPCEEGGKRGYSLRAGLRECWLDRREITSSINSTVFGQDRSLLR
jgi:hypothetical protein